ERQESASPFRPASEERIANRILCAERPTARSSTICTAPMDTAAKERKCWVIIPKGCLQEPVFLVRIVAADDVSCAEWRRSQYVCGKGRKRETGCRRAAGLPVVSVAG